jgi:hypothetical protein
MHYAGVGAAALLILVLAGCNKPAAGAAGSGAAAPPAVSAADAADVKTFLQGLYAHYQVDPSKSQWDNTDDKVIGTVFDGEIIAAWKAERAIQTDGPSDVDDGDFICQCQDWSPFTATITVTAANATTAKAAADFKIDDKARHVDFDLVKTPAGWRIHDLKSANAGEPPSASLRAAIAQATVDQQKAAAEAKKSGAD